MKAMLDNSSLRWRWEKLRTAEKAARVTAGRTEAKVMANTPAAGVKA